MITKKYYLPFNDVFDLKKTFDKILRVQRKKEKMVIERLNFEKIPYIRLKPFGFLIDMGDVPFGVDIKSILDTGDELMIEAYKKVCRLNEDKF
jgi:hypothetical protein